MGIFGQSSGFDADVEKATSESNTNENWSLILDVCDKTSSNVRNAKDCLKAIMKRMGHNDPHVVMQAITLLDACVSNCGKDFHLEIASREFQNEFLRLLAKAQPKVSSRMCQVLKGWAEGDFKNDPELNLIPSLYAKLRQDNYDFSGTNDKPTTSAMKISVGKSPALSSQQEEDDLAKAIELSLKEVKNSPKNVGTAASGISNQYPSLYPTVSSTAAPSSAINQTEPRKVRALYDFEAAEENELTFVAGDIIHVLDDSDPNWWKGFNQRGEGLFPSNFVSADLTFDPERLEINQQHKMKRSTQFEEDTKELQHKTEAAAAAAASQSIDIDEQKIDRLLHLLNEANPEDPSQDTEEMLRLEQEVHQMGPLIDAELERVDRKHAQLSQLSSDLVDAINLYHSLMRDDRNALGSQYHISSSMSALPGMTGYHSIPQPGHIMYGANTAFQGNFGPHSLQSALPYAAPSGNYQSPLNMSLQYQNGHANTQHTPHQAVPPQGNPQMITQQPLSLQQNHSQHQMFLTSNGQPQAQVNMAPAGDAQQNQPSQHQSYQVLPQQPQQQYIPPQSPSMTTTAMPPNINPAPSTQSTQQTHQTHFMSPQHHAQQQPHPFVNGTSTQLMSNPHLYNHQLPNGQPPYIGTQQTPNLPSNQPTTSSLDHLGQLQQQMTNMSIATQQPYSTSIQQNIPIYQQQR